MESAVLTRATTASPPEPPGAASAIAAPSRRPAFGVGAGAAVVVALAFLLPVVWSGTVFNWFTTPKSALALVALGPGLVVLGWLAARRDHSAIAAAAFLGWAALSTALAREPMMSLLGEYFGQNGLLLTAACVASWALGRTLDERSRPALVVAIVAAAAVNAAVVWLQTSTDLGVEALRPFQDRGTGFMGNPVQLASLCAAALWLVAAREREAERPLAWWALTVLLVGAVELSGSRIATVLALGLLAWFVVLHLRAGRRGRAGALVAVAVAGMVLAMAVGSSGTTTARAAEAGSSGLGTRTEMWSSTLEALTERPLVGFGPGRYVSVSSPRRTLEIARYEGPDVLYSDAHNLVVEYAVATGVVGLALLGLWLVVSARRVAGPLGGFCVIATVVGLLQPQYVGLTALLALALGGGMARAPTPRVADAPHAARFAVALGAFVALVGAAAGLSLVVGDTHYARASADRSLTELAAAQRRLPAWPQLSALGADLRHRPGTRPSDAVLAQGRQAIARDSQDPMWWATLGSIEAMRDHPSAAAAAFRETLVRNPWSFFGLSGSYQAARALHHQAAARALRTKLCRLGPTYCPPRSSLDRPAPGGS